MKKNQHKQVRSVCEGLKDSRLQRTRGTVGKEREKKHLDRSYSERAKSRLYGQRNEKTGEKKMHATQGVLELRLCELCNTGDYYRTESTSTTTMAITLATPNSKKRVSNSILTIHQACCNYIHNHKFKLVSGVKRKELHTTKAIVPVQLHLPYINTPRCGRAFNLM